MNLEARGERMTMTGTPETEELREIRADAQHEDGNDLER